MLLVSRYTQLLAGMQLGDSSIYISGPFWVFDETPPEAYCSHYPASTYSRFSG